ncbi:MAG TPA: hypothetical protein VHG09_04840 [Longimicrobiales bacterium]|nr:hypothetical protein [Longimicrobiales bacterium]
MMQRRKFFSLAASIAVLLTFTGCAARSAADPGEMLNVQIQVDNNLRGITGVSIYLLSDTGARRSLGPVESNDRVAYDRMLSFGDYQLIATRVGAEDIVSQRFRVDTDGLVVVWALSQNQLTFAQR